jgi:hypothetical protein
MFMWILRLCLWAFMLWTMSIPGTECYISPQIWSLIVLTYWFCNHPMHTPPHLR